MFEVGTTYKTRGGRGAKVLYVDAPGLQPIIGYIVCNGEAEAAEWGLDGSFYPDREDGQK